MRLAIVVALALLAALPAKAATYRIDVTGEFNTVSLLSVYSAQNPYGAESMEFAPDDMPFASGYLSEMLMATSGMATFDEGTGLYSDCGGMLASLCDAYPDRRTSIETGFLHGYGSFGSLIVDGSAIRFATDGIYRWNDAGTDYLGLGLLANGSLGSVSISAVPLPASGFLLIAAVLATLGLRRKRTA